MDVDAEEIQNLQARFPACRHAQLHRVALQQSFAFLLTWLKQPGLVLLLGSVTGHQQTDVHPQQC